MTSNIRSAIRMADDVFEATFTRGDATGLAHLYTNDGMLLPPGSEIVEGKGAIAAFWQGAMDMGIEEAKLDIVEVQRQGDSVIEMGRYTLKDADGAVMDEGKYIVIWKQEGDQWKLSRDIWNSSQAPEES